jgi:hypothetical protein
MEAEIYENLTGAMRRKYLITSCCLSCNTMCVPSGLGPCRKHKFVVRDLQKGGKSQNNNLEKSQSINKQTSKESSSSV